MTERRSGNSRLVYDKATRTIGPALRAASGAVWGELDQLRARATLLEKALRRLAIAQRHRLAEGGGTVHVGWTCKVCHDDWERNQPEHHEPTCILAGTAQ